METLETILAEMREVATRSEEIEAIEAPTDEDNEEFSTLEARFDELDETRQKLIAREEQREKVRQALNDPRNVVRGDNPDEINDAEGDLKHRGSDPFDLNRAVAAPPAEINRQARAAVEVARGYTDKGRQYLTTLLEGFEDGHDQEIAKRIVATSSPDYFRAFKRAVLATMAGRSDPEAEAILARAMTIGTTTEGGFAVPEQLDPNVVWLDAGTLNAVRGLARVVTATGDTWEGLTGTPGTWSWDTEAAEVSDDSVTVGRPSISIFMARGFIPFSIEVQGDYPGFMADMQTALVRGRDTLEADTHIDGPGTDPPFGITVALAGGAQENDTATSQVFAIADVYATQEVVAARYRSNASWLSHNNIGNAVRQFDTAGGAGMWERIGGDRPGLLLGRPFVESEEMDSDGTAAGGEILVFGDFSQYVIADRIGMNVELIPHLFQTTANLPSGERGLFAYFRSGADSINDLGFSQLQVQA